jgi:hypothetical protein
MQSMFTSDLHLRNSRLLAVLCRPSLSMPKHLQWRVAGNTLCAGMLLNMSALFNSTEAHQKPIEYQYQVLARAMHKLIPCTCVR